MTNTESTGSDIRPFRIQIPQADLDDLAERLQRTRFVDPAPSSAAAAPPAPSAPEGLGRPAGWEYGVPSDYVRRLVEYWRTGYDWRAWEAKLNAYPQFTTTIDGQNIHFLHVRSTERDALPLIITHGWPGSVVEFMEIIEPASLPTAP